jgi:hypothetical protein
LFSFEPAAFLREVERTDCCTVSAVGVLENTHYDQSGGAELFSQRDVWAGDIVSPMMISEGDG